jgi:hypothetical protein
MQGFAEWIKYKNSVSAEMFVTCRRKEAKRIILGIASLPGRRKHSSHIRAVVGVLSNTDYPIRAIQRFGSVGL